MAMSTQVWNVWDIVRVWIGKEGGLGQVARRGSTRVLTPLLLYVKVSRSGVWATLSVCGAW